MEPPPLQAPLKAGFSGPSSNLCPRDVRQTFHLRRRHAAHVLGITETCLKRIAEGRISRWPYRKFKKLKNLRRFILDKPAMKIVRKQAMLELISQDFERLQTDPDFELSPEIAKLSARGYKLKRKLVQVAALVAGDEEGEVTDDEDIVFWADKAERLEREREQMEGADVRLYWIHEAALSCQPAAPPAKHATYVQGTVAFKRSEIKSIEAGKSKAKAEAGGCDSMVKGGCEVGGQLGIVAAAHQDGLGEAPLFQRQWGVVPVQVPVFLNVQEYAWEYNIASLLQTEQQHPPLPQQQLCRGAINQGSTLRGPGLVEMWEYNLIQRASQQELERQANLLRSTELLLRRSKEQGQASSPGVGGGLSSGATKVPAVALGSSQPNVPTTSLAALPPPPPRPPVPFTPLSPSAWPRRSARPQGQLSKKGSQLMQQQMEEADHFLAHDSNLPLLCME